MSQSINNLIRKLEALPPSAVLERHNGIVWVKLGEARYQRLDDFALKAPVVISPIKDTAL